MSLSSDVKKRIRMLEYPDSLYEFRTGSRLISRSIIISDVVFIEGAPRRGVIRIRIRIKF